LRDLTTGNANCIIGRFGGHSITTGSANTFIGNNTGTVTNKNITGSNNTTLGMDAICGVDGLSYATAIGSGATVGTSNTIVLGRDTDTINISGDLIFTSASPVINTSTPAAFLDFQTATGGTGYMNFSPRGTLAFQIAAGGNTSVKLMDFQAGLSMSGGNANLSTSTLTCGAITTSGNMTLPATMTVPTAGQAGYNISQFFSATSLLTSTWRNIGTFTSLAPGIWSLHGCAYYALTVTGSTNLLQAGWSTIYNAFNVPAGGTLAGQLSCSNNCQNDNQTFVSVIPNYLTCSTIITLTTATTIYFNTMWSQNGAGIAFNVGGQASATRIA
jgi:hypothetical protein